MPREWHNILEFSSGEVSEVEAHNEGSARATFAGWQSHADIKTITLVDAEGLTIDTWTNPNAAGSSAAHNESESKTMATTNPAIQNARQPVGSKHVRARRADHRDAEVGRRVRARRLECRLSQTELADRIGVTFQQVQKYEKGVNRIGAGRLQRITEALEVPVSFFFKDGTVAKDKAGQQFGASQLHLISTSGAARLLTAYHKIKSRKQRQLVVELAEELANNAD